MKTFNNLLIELPINPIYKDFKKSIAKPIQLPLPFEFSDEFFESKKEQMDHALRTMHGMKIGYEFEIYLPGEEPVYKLDLENPILSIEGFTNVTDDFIDILQQHFDFDDNRDSYEKLEVAYQKWKKESIEKDADENGYDKNDYDEFLANISDTDYSFDDYVRNNFNSRSNWALNYNGALLNLIHHFNFENSEYGFNEDGYLITDIDFPDVVVNENNTHHKNLGRFLMDKLGDVPVKVLDTYHGVKKNANTWYIEPDGSLVETPDNYFPVEVSTKPYPAIQFKSLFLTTLKWFSEFAFPKKPVTNTSTGLHFSVSFTDKRPIDFLKLVVLGQDSFWLKKVGRQFNIYCSSQIDLVKSYIDRNKDNFVVNKDNVQDIIHDANEAVLDPHNNSEYLVGLDVSSKKMAINFSKYKEFGYIEFRLAGNDYYRSQKRHLEMIEWFLRILVAAATPNMFQGEYHRWLIYQFNKH